VKKKHLTYRDLREILYFSYDVGMLSDKDVIDIIDDCGNLLNLIKPSDLSKVTGKSLSACSKETKGRKIVTIFNTKFISEKEA
jgi:hypothetical protein